MVRLNSQMLLAAALALLLFTTAGFLCSRTSSEAVPGAATDGELENIDPSEPEEEAEERELAPMAALNEYIEAQETADWAGVVNHMTAESAPLFDAASEDMTQDDLIAAGLQLREERYELASLDDTTAIFFSRVATLYLVMTLEGQNWKVDPAATDRMNLVED